MTDADLISYYQALLIMQFVNKPRAVATVDAFVGEGVADQIVQAVEDAFDVTTSVGVQLDAIATYRGVSRNVVGLDFSRPFFSMPSYGGTESGVKGFALYGDTVNWFFLTYEDAAQVIYRMNDTELRTIIELEAALQASTLGLGEIDQILFDFFGSYVTLTDNRNMTITYTGSSSEPDNLFVIATETECLPAPAGVGVTYTTV